MALDTTEMTYADVYSDNYADVDSSPVFTKVFTPPTRSVRLSGDRLFRYISQDAGRTVLKVGTTYRLTDDPSNEDVESADIAYLGGRSYPVSDSEADSLTQAGYGAFLATVEVSPSPPDPVGGGGDPTDPTEYGLGAYGAGVYGS